MLYARGQATELDGLTLTADLNFRTGVGAAVREKKLGQVSASFFDRKPSRENT